jgi:hypothetical protein
MRQKLYLAVNKENKFEGFVHGSLVKELEAKIKLLKLQNYGKVFKPSNSGAKRWE